MRSTRIEWTDSTWNPVTGCTKVSSGCANCYAERMALRLQAMGQSNYENGFRVQIHEHALRLPLNWRKPQVIFVNSMGDLFHDEVPLWFIERVFETMEEANWHQFQMLTKRDERLAELAPGLRWPPNVWMGVSVENRATLRRMDALRGVPAAVRFVSFEPLLEDLGRCDLDRIDWAIVGGESGPGARPIEEAWVIGLRDQIVAAGVPFFFKQWGGTNKKKNSRLLEGRTWDEIPDRAGILL